MQCVRERRKEREGELCFFCLHLPKKLFYKTLRQNCGAAMNIWLNFSCMWFELILRVEKEGEENNLYNIQGLSLLPSSTSCSLRSLYIYICMYICWPWTRWCWGLNNGKSTEDKDKARQQKTRKTNSLPLAREHGDLKCLRNINIREKPPCSFKSTFLTIILKILLPNILAKFPSCLPFPKSPIFTQLFWLHVSHAG